MKWNGKLQVVAPDGTVTKTIERIIRGTNTKNAERNAAYMARPWMREGDKLSVDLKPMVALPGEAPSR